MLNCQAGLLDKTGDRKDLDPCHLQRMPGALTAVVNQQIVTPLKRFDDRIMTQLVVQSVANRVAGITVIHLSVTISG